MDASVHFLGGADEIGASCVMVETATTRVLVDCGLRIEQRGAAALPDIEAVHGAGGPDAVVVTHAHLDHSGALPVLSDFFPAAPVIATPATLGLMGILLRDAVNVMRAQYEETRSVPLFSEEGVERLAQRVRPLDFDSAWRKGDVVVTLLPAGHVVGAAQVVVGTPAGDVLVTGDVSGPGQRTVAGMWVPRIRPRLVVCESTYGARIHADRRAEEARLVDRVVGAAAEGRRVLVPAFALGRAQEVILALARRAADAGVEVWVDGMVRRVCDAFSSMGAWLAPGLRKRIERGASPLRDGTGPVRFVPDAGARERLIERKGLVVVASSGMLTGGASLVYARRWLGDEDALVVLTGYQDEESPGAGLEAVASGERRTLRLEGRDVEVRCEVQKVGLSAHADGSELARTIEALRPAEAALVHGDAGSRMALAERIGTSRMPVHLPARGEVVELGTRTAGRREVDARVPSAGDVEALAVRLLETGGRRALGVEEIHRLALGAGRDATVPEEALSATRRLVEASGLFRPDAARPFLFRPAAPATRDLPLDQTSALDEARAVLGSARGFIKVGADVEARVIRVAFELPDAQVEPAHGSFEEIESRTGWRVEPDAASRPEALEREARRASRGVFEPSQRAGINAEARTVVLKGRWLDDDDDAVSRAREEFEARTGWQLLFKREARSAAVVPGKVSGGRLEINAAYLAIEQALAGSGHALLKRGRRGSGDDESIEVTFVTPAIGERLRPRLDEIERETGWRLTVRPHPDQASLFAIVRDVIPQGWKVAKGPSLFASRSAVGLRLDAAPGQEAQAVRDRFRELTGYDLELE